MEDWTIKTDAEVFTRVGEQPGAQYSYERSVEMQRRIYVLQHSALQAQVDATTAQREAISEMRVQSRYMLLSVVGAFLAAFATLAAAIVQWATGS